MLCSVAGDPYYDSVSLLLPMNGADESTTFLDYSKTTKTVTASGGAKIDTAQSKWGDGSGYFDGNGDYLTVTSSSELSLTGDFTIECWIYLASSTQDEFATVLGSGQGTYQNGCRYFLVGSTRIVRLGGNFGAGSVDVVTAAAAISANEWHFIAVARSGTSVKLFIDGVQSGSDGSSSATFDFSASNTLIGKNGWDGSNGELNACLQDFRITKGVCRYSGTFAVPIIPVTTRGPDLSVRRTIQPSHRSIASLGL